MFQNLVDKMPANVYLDSLTYLWIDYWSINGFLALVFLERIFS